jgi:hypothetical protein
MEHFDVATLVVDGLFTLVAFLGGFLLKTMWSAIDKLREDMLELNKAIARDYVRRDDFSGHVQRLESMFAQHQTHMNDMLNRIYDKLDGKADRPR